MENSELNRKNNEFKEKKSFLLVPFIYIKRALIRIWGFLPKGLSIGFNSIFKYFIIFL